MTLNAEQRRELHELIGALCDGAIDADRFARLQAILSENLEAQRFYVRYLDLHGAIRRLSSNGQWPVVSGPCEEESGIGGQDTGASIHPSSFSSYSSPIPPLVIDPTPASRSTLGSFIFSHMAAAVILGIGLLIGLAWRISAPSPEKQDMHVAGVQEVGRITALADCQGRQWSVANGQWLEIANHHFEVNHLFYVGDRFHISSGLMEITYKTGAKVILQGPCAYAINSNRGGFLAMGKLTAKVEKKGERRGERGENQANHQLEIINHKSFSPLFAVQTPIAVVTDLGTEFGVEVEKSGATRSHVFQGKIELRSQAVRKVTPSGPSVVLEAGQSALVAKGRSSVVTITRTPAQPERYVRRMSQGERGELIAHNQSEILNRKPNMPLYHFADLGTLGGPMSRAKDVNQSGWVVGESKLRDGVTHAFLYSNGRMKDLGTLDGGSSWAYGINAQGQVVGGSGIRDPQSLAFVYDQGRMEDLGTLGGSVACAYAINDAGTIVGASQNANGIIHAFLKADGQKMKDLGSLGGPNGKSRASSINAKGLVVGCSETPSGIIHAYLYSEAAGMKDLNTLGVSRSWALHVNNSGQVLGYVDAADGSRHAFIYRNGVMKPLGSRDGLNGMAFDVNNAGQVVGGLYIGGNVPSAHAFLYDVGVTIDLNALAARPTGWTFQYATAINDSGQIVGHGTAPNGQTRAFLLTPVNEARNEGRGAGNIQNH